MSETANERLLARLLGPAQEEVSCDACFQQLDRYVEFELSGGDPERALPGMRAHLAGCPACAEDHRSLLDFAALAQAASVSYERDVP
ncbi:MAG: hypothetical protein ACRDKL_12565 [Solirubrobacteraceae bacterium]